MYIRPSVVRKGGKTYRYYRLVRSVRRNGKVVQETVAHLGELDARGRVDARALADRICGVRATQQRSFFEAAAAGEPRTVRVRLDQLRVERQRRFGDVWLGLTLWQALGLDTVCAEVLPSGQESVPWSLVAAIQVIARLCEPASELDVAERWYPRTAWEDLLGVPAEMVNDDRLYRVLDHLVWHKSDLEHHLKARLGELFQLEYDLLLYEVTSTYFEGLAAANGLAHHGYSRDHRPDCRQVCIALVVTREGMPLGYEVCDGNTTDVTTVQTIVGTREARYGLASRIWVMDRGMCSQKNLKWLRATGRRYVVGAARRALSEVADDLRQTQGWHAVREGVYVLRTNILDWSPDMLWKTYIQLTESAVAFRIHKSDLSLRPIWHQRADRGRTS